MIDIRKTFLGPGDKLAHTLPTNYHLIVFRGIVRVTQTWPGGKHVEELAVGDDRLIRNHLTHEFIGLAEDNEFWCITSCRSNQIEDDWN